MKQTFKESILILQLVVLLGACSQQTEKEVKKATGTNLDQLLVAIDKINNDLREDSLNPDLYQKRAEIYLGHEAYNEAFKDITSALELDSSYSGYYVTLSDVYLGMGKFQKTMEALEKAILLDGNNAEAYLGMAEMSIVIRDYKKALDFIDKALQVDDLIEKAYMLRGVVLMENGDTIRGILNFQKAVDINQRYLEAHIQLGTLYALQKNDLAIDYFNNALNIDPANIDVLYSLGMYFQETGRYEKAIQSYNLILNQDPDFYIARFNIGYINLVYLRDFDAAIDYFTQTIEVRPDYTEAYYNRGFAYELNKDAENSMKDYNKVLELHPNYEKAIEGLNRITEYLESN